MAHAFEVDGPFTGQLAQWAEYQEFLRSSVEWVKREGGTSRARSHIELNGRIATVQVELDPEEAPPKLRRAIIIEPGERTTQEVTLRQVGPHRQRGHSTQRDS